MIKVLIVEDEEKIARFIELELKHEGYEVDKALDGRTGAEKALTNDYDLILLDILLPQLNGLEVLRRIRREKNTPTIMLTARDSVMDKVAVLMRAQMTISPSLLRLKNFSPAFEWHSSITRWTA